MDTKSWNLNIVCWILGCPWCSACRVSLIDCLVTLWGWWGAITILTGDDYEFILETIWIGAGVILFIGSSSVIPSSITCGSLTQSESLTRIPLLASALSLYVISAAMWGLSSSVLRACRDDLFAIWLNLVLPSGNWKTLLMWTLPWGLFYGYFNPKLSMWYVYGGIFISLLVAGILSQ